MNEGKTSTEVNEGGEMNEGRKSTEAKEGEGESETAHQGSSKGDPKRGPHLDPEEGAMEDH